MNALLALALTARLAAAEGEPAPDAAIATAGELATPEGAPAPAAATAPADEWAAAPSAALDPGRMALAAGAGMPVHFVASVGVLTFACSGEVIGASCGRTIDGSGGALAATYLLLATIPPLASGAVVWALGDDDDAPASLPWTLAGGAVGQLAGFGLALATDSPAVALLSLTAFPVAGELLGLALTRGPPAASYLPPPPAGRPAASTDARLLPIASLRF